MSRNDPFLLMVEDEKAVASSRIQEALVTAFRHAGLPVDPARIAFIVGTITEDGSPKLVTGYPAQGEQEVPGVGMVPLEVAIKLQVLDLILTTTESALIYKFLASKDLKFADELRAKQERDQANQGMFG